MTHITDTLTISATRLMDLSREVLLQLGEWQYHRHLTVHASNHQGDAPSVFVTLSQDADELSRRDFIDAFSMAMDVPVRTFEDGAGWLLVVPIPDYDSTGVTVSASVSVGGAR
ncbi:hypothetical protein KGD82_13360 [Nocardiopsis eucommiae]|uniref:Uncharacterized protein n=1 Tax=Nocardiopsis eucommiae TaxID=2831970 RepID=A0A975LD87_9ACTN|nr:hypothetical protein KGD82_13360 [Nocardiopsis eucommiae]